MDCKSTARSIAVRRGRAGTDSDRGHTQIIISLEVGQGAEVASGISPPHAVRPAAPGNFESIVERLGDSTTEVPDVAQTQA
jgi:hypothetical protein